MRKPGCLRAYSEGRAAELGTANPYAYESSVLAKMWRRGYQTMLNERFYGRQRRDDSAASARA
jgi:hypothetical protein